MNQVSLLDYGAGNVRSLRNAIRSLGYEVNDITTADEILSAQAILFPGVGSFGQAMKSLKEQGWVDALKTYLQADRPFFGICLGMQSLFEGSEEDPEEAGLGIIPGKVSRFDSMDNTIRIPHIGWNGIIPLKSSVMLENHNIDDSVYFVHSFCVLPTEANQEWALACTDYGTQRYISMVQKGNIVACQFHPEKSGIIGLTILKTFLEKNSVLTSVSNTTIASSNINLFVSPPTSDTTSLKTQLVKRIITALDVRSNDTGDLVVTKGDQYDVREADSNTANGRGEVRNLGKPVQLCERYYNEGADEVVFLNITNFRQGVLEDAPMLQVLERASETVFVPLTVGGGIREYTDPASGMVYSALDVASRYFSAGADKVSIGSDAVTAVEVYLNNNHIAQGTSCLEQISAHYGAQAVVVSIDPKRVYLAESTAPEGLLGDCEVITLPPDGLGPNGETHVWYQVTIKGGRETRPLCAVNLAKVCQILGAGELMVNCIDMDGQGNGYDLPLMTAIQNKVNIPVIASSGAGNVAHFSEVFIKTDVMAALAAGMFHRNEVEIREVKSHLKESNIPVRPVL